MELKERETRIDALQNETLDLKRRLKKRDDEIGRLQREIHKLKVPSVLILHPSLCGRIDEYVVRAA